MHKKAWTQPSHPAVGLTV